MSSYERGDAVAIFAHALELADLLLPLRSGKPIDDPTAGAFGQEAVRLHVRPMKELLKAALSSADIPPGVLKALTAIDSHIRALHTVCPRYCDVALYLARSDLRELGQEGWKEVMRASAVIAPTSGLRDEANDLKTAATALPITETTISQVATPDSAGVGGGPLAGTVAAQSTIPSRAFDGGVLTFHPDRVELCGVVICSGPRSQSKRIILELLAQKRPDGRFVAYSGESLEAKMKAKGAQGKPGGVIRDIREGIEEGLKTQGIACGREDVILSGGPGYRYSNRLSVQDAAPPATTDIADLEVADVTDTDVPCGTGVTNPDGPIGTDVTNPDAQDGTDVTDAEVPGDTNDKSPMARQTWIVMKLAKGKRLRLEDICIEFGYSKRSALRDMQTLEAQGKTEFVGSTRSGYYRLKQPPNAPNG